MNNDDLEFSDYGRDGSGLLPLLVGLFFGVVIGLLLAYPIPAGLLKAVNEGGK